MNCTQELVDELYYNGTSEIFNIGLNAFDTANIDYIADHDLERLLRPDSGLSYGYTIMEIQKLDIVQEWYDSLTTRYYEEIRSNHFFEIGMVITDKDDYPFDANDEFWIIPPRFPVNIPFDKCVSLSYPYIPAGMYVVKGTFNGQVLSDKIIIGW